MAGHAVAIAEPQARAPERALLKRIPYGFGEKRVATLALFTLTALSG